MRRRVLALLFAGLLAVTVAGCGEDEGVGQSASAALTPQVQAVRSAAEKGNRDEALARLAGLRQTVAQLRTSGDLTEQGAATVLEAAVDVERRLALLPAPPPSTAATGARGGSPGTTSPGVRDDDARKAAEDARKRAEEAVKKAEEDAKKRAEDARKRAEEGRKD